MNIIKIIKKGIGLTFIKAKKKSKKIKIYHDIRCTCYDCRAGISLKAKD